MAQRIKHVCTTSCDHDPLLLETYNMVDDLWQDWLGLNGKEGLRGLVLANRDRAVKNEGRIQFIGWIGGFLATAAIGVLVATVTIVLGKV